MAPLFTAHATRRPKTATTAPTAATPHAGPGAPRAAVTAGASAVLTTSGPAETVGGVTSMTALRRFATLRTGDRPPPAAAIGRVTPGATDEVRAGACYRAWNVAIGPVRSADRGVEGR